jgi:hypothetical protein
MLLKVKIVPSIITKPEANTDVKKNEVFKFFADLDLQSKSITYWIINPCLSIWKALFYTSEYLK